MRLTDDDLSLIDSVAKYRFLTSRHLQRLLPYRSRKKLIERLAVLYHHGYLDRPRAQLTYYATAGSAPMVYALGNEGARILAERGGSDAGKIDWTWKNRDVGRPFIEHSLLTADLMIGLHCDLRERADARVIEPTEIAQRVGIVDFKLTVQDGPSEFAVRPDYAFGIARGDRAKFFFLESDRATMPVVRSDPRQSSVQRKFRCYLAGGGRENLFGRQVGIDNFRVLVLTSSRERIDNMLMALKLLTAGKGSRQFLFADQRMLKTNADLANIELIDGKGASVGLLD